MDRYKSVMGESVNGDAPLMRNMKANELINLRDDVIRSINQHPPKMKEFINRYKKATEFKESQEIVAQFQRQQQLYRHDRQKLNKEVNSLENNQDTPEYHFMKGELIKAVKNQINLELELNTEITTRKKQRENQVKQMMQGSKQIQNAYEDIQRKRQEIQYLVKSIKDCLQLLEIIGVLTKAQGQKIDEIEVLVQNANVDIEKAERNIDAAKVRMEKAKNRWCCIIILALIAIIIILVVLFGFVIKFT